MKGLLQNLNQNKLKLSPLEIEKIEKADSANSSTFQIKWKENSKVFLAHVFSTPTPKNIESRIYSIKKSVSPDYFPLLITTYLSEENLQRLIDEEVSGIDLCGNGVVIADDWFIYRSGAKNKFPSNAPIKNIFRGTSSIVARVFLIKNEFQNAGEILSEIENRGGKTTLSTVSKVVKTLEEELIISKSQTIKLINPNRLLEQLKTNYQVEPTQKIIGKVPDLNNALEKMKQNAKANDIKFVCFDSSKYAISATSSPILKIYTELIENLLNDIEFEKTNRFANLEICQTTDQTVYFDKRENNTSPLQVYFELANSGKREQETAESLKLNILRGEV